MQHPLPPDVEPPLLEERIDLPDIPLLDQPLAAELLEAPLLSDVLDADQPAASAATPDGEPLARIERELQAAARQIVHEVVADYLPAIEQELHRRLEEQLGRLLRAGRR